MRGGGAMAAHGVAVAGWGNVPRVMGTPWDPADIGWKDFLIPGRATYLAGKDYLACRRSS